MGPPLHFGHLRLKQQSYKIVEGQNKLETWIQHQLVVIFNSKNKLLSTNINNIEKKE